MIWEIQSDGTVFFKFLVFPRSRPQPRLLERKRNRQQRSVAFGNYPPTFMCIRISPSPSTLHPTTCPPPVDDMQRYSTHTYTFTNIHIHTCSRTHTYTYMTTLVVCIGLEYTIESDTKTHQWNNKYPPYLPSLFFLLTKTVSLPSSKVIPT